MAKIMIVDDAAFVRTMLRHMLDELGHEIVAEANDGSEAVKLYVLTRPDIVTMDISMPVLDGISATEQIMKIHSEANIIVCTARGQHNKVIEAYAAGAKDFLVKPLQKERLQTAIEQILNL